MTKLERKQKRTIFKQAGFKAFGLGIHWTDNPYRDQPFKDLWADGYRAARKAFEAANPRGRRG